MDKAVACRKDYYIYSHQEQEDDSTKTNYVSFQDLNRYVIVRLWGVCTAQHITLKIDGLKSLLPHPEYAYI